MFGHSYLFRVGDIVQLPASSTFIEIQWRGQLQLGPPGQKERVDVYWLGEPHWDCYYEEELLAIGQLPF
ncbi:hypothetical protein [Hymenobacter artigasi]|uniref:DUF5348 domain-containing protein n=1 Tax=Hymenobacter artigasi TaxID=2719616 RepID=A0ABX1HN70_9BACT|nr:hypothetical protein [Hymenobacter artigasi]NKI91590.1 hypothetical protein [Hymenobacter artigasi]